MALRGSRAGLRAASVTGGETLPPPAAAVSPDDGTGDTLASPTSPPGQAARRFARNKLAVVSLALIVVLLATTCIAQWLPLIDPTATDAANTDAWPSGQHLL